MHVLLVCPIVRRIILLFIVSALCLLTNGQKKWDGEGGDGLWNTAANWVGNTVPSGDDDVLLDHSVIASNYVVTFPSAMATVTIRSLNIFPTVSGTIEVILPVSNTVVPAFTTIGSVYGLEIHNGGIFRNSSGASAGTPVEISDSIKIHNGGSYIHNTSRAHASNVTVLSKVPGTEQGSFEFDVPGGAGYTVSIAGRVYGNLILSAVAAGGTKSYTSTGATTVNINGQFRINAGVNYSLNFNGGFVIQNDFVHQGNVFDISGGTFSNRITLKGNLSQTGIITESGTGFPVIEFAGTISRNITITGSITENNTLRINGSGISLLTPLTISYKLELLNGNIRTMPVNILILKDNGTCSGGSVNSFVDGPMRKVGDDDFEFPIGKQGNYAPVIISGPGGNSADQFEAEYLLGNPTIIFGSSVENPPIIHNSSLEYWKVERVAGVSAKKVSLSIRTYSNATLLEKLVVSRWDIPGSIWRNEGNTAYSGIATGVITSTDVHSFGIFTIASTVADQNPLPLTPITFNASSRNADAILTWQIDRALQIESFEILKSGDNIHFVSVTKMPALITTNQYRFSEKLSPGISYYKVKMTIKNGGIVFSDVRSVFNKQSGIELRAYPSVVTSCANLIFNASERTVLRVFIMNTEGKIIHILSMVVDNGSHTFPLNTSAMAAGVYYLTGIANGIRTNVIRIVIL